MHTSKKLALAQKKLTGVALEFAQRYNIHLDFSNKSIKFVEKILDKLHKHYKKTKDEEELQVNALVFASYIITVIERNFNAGEWKRDHPKFGKDSFPYYWGDLTLFPKDWCIKRISDGEKENVWIKYDVITNKKYHVADVFNSLALVKKK